MLGCRNCAHEPADPENRGNYGRPGEQQTADERRRIAPEVSPDGKLVRSAGASPMGWNPIRAMCSARELRLDANLQTGEERLPHGPIELDESEEISRQMPYTARNVWSPDGNRC